MSGPSSTFHVDSRLFRDYDVGFSFVPFLFYNMPEVIAARSALTEQLAYLECVAQSAP